MKLALDERSRIDLPAVFFCFRLLNDNGSSYIAGDLAVWLEDQGVDHVCGAPNHYRVKEKNKNLTIQKRRLDHQRQAA